MTRRTPSPPSAADRRFLLLQGPHGPFFARLGDLLRAAGAEVWRVGFNRGDEFFWRRRNYVAFRAPFDEWETHLTGLLANLSITDLVLYGDSRPIHATAIRLAKERGLRVHVFEEGYLRPYWITYERDGSNGNSRLMQLDLSTMRAALARPGAEHPAAPVRWGDMREHMFYGALYHFLILTLNHAYPGHLPHREINVTREARLHLRRFLAMPFVRIRRRLAEWRIRRSGFPYHLVLLQLEHDASFRAHSDFASMADFVTLCLDAFARGAAAHHHLVFKAHPLEDGRVPLARLIREGAAARGLSTRVHFVTGGKLAQLLREAASAVTVNSTAAQQALWRGLPVKLLGRAVYDKPEFVSPQPLADFFATPSRPDSRAYSDYRQFLLETSQIPGGFYSSRGRRRALRRVVDMMLAPHDPYVTLLQADAAERQHIRVVS
ncbi:capsular biosynthesis protein [Frigidibacter sp. RF13]|uniref:capsule biosynthesis protein n=1 Tax=Frigidibacter sp. RF13 TaxID=2997340 RepID=UPI002272016D|nr:capsular biosynthesis protein [Frigidibacter sp. RF13]MCY1126042.1 capsular biosynthesis protein [Frigidibacter sp. RF13]